MTEAASSVLDCGFCERGLIRVYARADSRNIGSWRVMEKLGMTRGGVLREHVVARDGVRCDQVFHGITKREWA